MHLNELADALLNYAESQGIELTGQLNEDEPVLRDLALKVGARTTERHLERIKPGYEGPHRPCPQCDQKQKFVQHRARTVATLMGQVTFKRAYYRCPHCRCASLPYDQQVGLGDEAVSPALAQAVTLCAAHDPYETSGRMLKALTGQSLATSTIHAVTQRVGSVAAAEEQALAHRMSNWDSPPAEARPQRLYVEADGVMAHTDGGWHECKTVTCHWTDEKDRVQSKPLTRCEKIDDFVPHVWALACRCGLEHAQEVILLGDGAAWIWDRIAPVLEPTAEIVDWYHACEHLWTCGRALHGQQGAEAWVEPKQTLLWEGQVLALLRQLQAEHKRARSPDKRKALKELITYLKNQDDRLDYRKFRDAGYDIGSGRVESACNNGVQVRAKRPGMHWSSAGLQPVLSLRAQWLSNDWDKLWQKRPLAIAA